MCRNPTLNFLTAVAASDDQYDTETFRQRVELLLNATKQYVFLSSARVYGNEEIPITEKSPRLLDCTKDKDFLNTDEYALTKARQENILQNSGKNNWTIIRPYITYSEGRLQVGTLEKEDWLYRALHGRTIVFSEDICQKQTTLTYGLDVAKGLAAIIGNNKALGEIFHITLNERQSISWQQVLEIYTDVLEKYLGCKPKIYSKSDDFLNLRNGIRHKQIWYQVLYDRLYDRIFDNSKISEFIDTENFIAIEDGLKNCLQEFLKNTRFKGINWQIQAKMDKLTKEFTPLKEIEGFNAKIKYLTYRIL